MATLIEEKDYTKIMETAETEVKLDVKSFHQLLEVGILKEDDRIELLNGRMYEMTPIGLRHMSVLNKLGKVLNNLSGKNFIVSIQNALRISKFAEIYPDIALLLYREDFYIDNYPDTEKEVFLIIEVADTSLNYDRLKKVPLYAEAKISEVWILNLKENVAEIYQNPDFEKREYTMFKKVRRGEIKPLRLGDVTLKIEEIL